VEAAAEKAGITKRTLDRARSLLDVRTRKRRGRGGHWEICLPESASRAPGPGLAAVGNLVGVQGREVSNREGSQDRQPNHVAPATELKSEPCAHPAPLDPWIRTDGATVCGVCHPNPGGKQPGPD